ncbi:MAG: hypothetical protein WKF35_04430 [Ferruginibacter sp.]
MHIYLLIIILVAFKPQKKNISYEIVYDYKSSIYTNVLVSDSIELLVINGDGDTAKSKILNQGSQEKYKFSLQIIVSGNDDSSAITYAKNDESSDILIEVNSPDKLIYKKNKWYSYKKHKIVELSQIRYSSISTNLYKTISGYKCRKYLINVINGNNDFEIWITNQLPSTLMPGGGYKPFPGAVLEMFFPDSGESFKALKVRKL